jgi:8-oxo-dGTP pyrophosphatase MutT (NUDIX family)
MENKKHIVAVNSYILSPCKTKFLVLKRNVNEIAYPGKWAIPGGKLEKGERVIDAIKREVSEETNLEIEDSLKFIGDFTFVRPDGHNVVGLVFIANAKTEEVKIPDREFEEFRWVTKKEFYDLDFIEGMEEEVEKLF